MIRVLIVDDHQLVRIGTSRLLEDVKGLEIIANADSDEQAIEFVQQLSPDVVLMDVQMLGIGGFEATRRCLRIDSDVKIIAVTMHEDEPYPSKLLKAGVSGYITKKANMEEMVRAIRKVMAGERYISSDVAQQLALRPFYDRPASPFEQLSSREMQITLMVIMRHKVNEILERLSLSPKIINSYRYRIFEKLNVNNDVSLMKLAIMQGIIETEVAA